MKIHQVLCVGGGVRLFRAMGNVGPFGTVGIKADPFPVIGLQKDCFIANILLIENNSIELMWKSKSFYSLALIPSEEQSESINQFSVMFLLSNKPFLSVNS